MNTPFAKDNNLLALKVSIDNAVIEQKSKLKGLTDIPEIEMTTQAYPYAPDRLFNGFDPVTVWGSFYTIFVPLCVFMLI